MTLQTGECVWIPCEVAPGPFPDERKVRVDSPAGCWVGFVDTKLLRDNVSQGRTALLATVVSIGDLAISARLPGQTAHSGYLTCSPAWFQTLA